MEKEYTREELIQLCLDSYVPYTLWEDRDSYLLQQYVQHAYYLLTSGVDFHAKVEGDMIGITVEVNKENKNMIISKGLYMDIDDVELYRQENPESEIFEKFHAIFGYDTQYVSIPTRERLEKYKGRDWC